MHSRQPAAFPSPAGLETRSSAIGLIALLLGAGALLRVLAGPPRLPTGLPSPADLRALLAGSTLAPEGVAASLVGLAWLLWLWSIGSLLLEALVVACETISHGAVWASQLRQVANRVSVPFARRAMAATLAVHVLTRAVPVAAAQPLTGPELALVVHVDQPSASALDPAADADNPDAATMQTYVVQPGDTLWSIAEATYGSGTEYRRIVEANVGRRVAPGQRFTAAGVIQPGWELQLPPASTDAEDRDGQRWYTVRAGDTLAGIAARLLHDPARWSDLFALNRGAATANGQYRLEDPNLIWPGLRLRLPDDPASPPSADPPPAQADSPSELADPQPESADAPAEPADQPPDPAAAPSPPPPAAADPSPTLQTAVVSLPTPLAQPTAPPTPVPDLAPPVAAAADPPPESSGEVDQAQPLAAEPTAPAPPGMSLPIPLASPSSLSALGLAGLAGAALGARRLRRLRPLPQEPESEVLVEGGYAEAQLTQDFARNLQGGGFDPVTAIVTQLLAFLQESQLPDVSLVAVRHGRSSTTLSLAAGLADQARLLELAPAFAARIEAEVETCLSADQDVVLRLTRLRKTRLLPPADARQLEVPLLVPLGVLYDRQTLVAAWPALGHILVASLPGQGSETILTSLVATLTARRSPQELALWCVHPPRALPAALAALPHVRAQIDPTDAVALAGLVDRLRAELDRRTRAPSRADLIVLIPELLQLGEHAANLALLARRAGAVGVRLIVGTSDPAGSAAHPLLPHLGTRMVLHMEDEDTSVGLLGAADAAYLGGGGRLLLRLDGRQPVELYGYQVAPEHLERLVRVMRASYQIDPAATYQVDPAPLATRPDHDPPPPAPQPATPPAAPATPTPPVHLPGPIASQPATNGRPPQPTEPTTPLRQPAAPAEPASSADSTDSADSLDPASSTDSTDSADPTEPADSTDSLDPLDPPDSPDPASSANPAAPAEPAERADPAQLVDSGKRADPATPAAPADSATPAAACPAGPPLRVICLGGPRVLFGTRQVWPARDVADGKAFELLVYLACQPPEGVAREDVTEALWPEGDFGEDDAHRIRNLRYRLRKVLESVTGEPQADGILPERLSLRLDPDRVQSDAHEFLRLVHAARLQPGPAAVPLLEQARAVYAGDLLAGPDARRYAWVDERDASGVTLREHFRRQFQQATRALADTQRQLGHVSAATQLYRELVEMDPTDDDCWQALFQLHAQRGDRAALVREEQRMRELLRALSGDDGPRLDPSYETRLAYQQALATLDATRRVAVEA